MLSYFLEMGLLVRRYCWGLCHSEIPGLNLEFDGNGRTRSEVVYLVAGVGAYVSHPIISELEATGAAKSLHPPPSFSWSMTGICSLTCSFLQETLSLTVVGSPDHSFPRYHEPGCFQKCSAKRMQSLRSIRWSPKCPLPIDIGVVLSLSLTKTLTSQDGHLAS